MKILVLVVGIVFCSGIAVVAVRWGLADSHGDVAYNEMASWDKEPRTEEGWLLAHRELERALELNPVHPAYLQRMGRLLMVRMWMKPAERVEHGNLAIEFVEQSLEVRPQWPSAWSLLAYLKHQLGEYDTRFNEAVMNASKYGPWEPTVLIRIAHIGAGAWGHLTEPVRMVVIGNIERSLLSPVRVVPRVVVETILNKASGLDESFAQKIGTLLVDIGWTKNSQIASTGLVVKFWSAFTTKQRHELAVKVAEVVAKTGKLGLVKGMDNEVVQASICPYLPKKPKFKPICANL